MLYFNGTYRIHTAQTLAKASFLIIAFHRQSGNNPRIVFLLHWFPVPIVQAEFRTYNIFTINKQGCETMGLFDIFKKKTPKKPAPAPASPHRDLTHLTADGELPYGWIYANREFVKPIEEEYRYFFDEWYKAHGSEDVKRQYAALKSLVMFQEDVQKLCAQKGECFAKWATYMVATPSEVQEYKEQLAHMTENMDALLQREKLLKKLKADLLAIIEAEPGVVQEKLYKRFPAEQKTDIGKILWYLSAQEIIRREKAGRSYALYIAEQEGRLSE